MTQPNPAPQADPGTQAPVPPWERDGTEFSKERAWQLLQAKEADLVKARGQVAELAPFKTRVEQIENEAKTELQRAQEAAAKAQKDATDAQLALLRHQVANRPGKVLPPEFADRLRGGTKAELEADADVLLAALPQQQQSIATQTAPVESLRPGVMPQQQQPDLDALIKAAAEKGDLRESLRLKNLKLQAAQKK